MRTPPSNEEIDALLQMKSYETNRLQKYFIEDISSVMMNIHTIEREKEKLVELINNLLATMLVAPAKEEDDKMNDAIIEIRNRVNTMDTNIRQLEKEVVAVKTTIDLKFEALTESIKELKTSVNSMDGKITSTAVDIRDEIKTKLSEGVTTKRFNITTLLTVIGILVAIGASLISLFKP